MTFNGLKIGSTFTWKTKFPQHVLMIKRTETEYQWINATPPDVIMKSKPEEEVWRWGRFKDGD